MSQGSRLTQLQRFVHIRWHSGNIFFCGWIWRFCDFLASTPPPYLTPSADISPHLTLHSQSYNLSLSLSLSLPCSFTLSPCCQSLLLYVCVCVWVRPWDRWAMTWLSAAALGQSCAVVSIRTMETRVADLSGYHSALTCLSLSNPLSLSHAHILSPFMYP